MGSYHEAFSTGDFDSTWLEQLHPLKEVTRKVKADIILVPGLGGDYIGTWQADDKPGTVWPRDLLPLPNHLPDVRVVSFKYNTSLNGTTSQAGIRDHANDLLVWLSNDREDDETASLRPLVFVGHSLGGVIIKRALTIMAHNIKYQDLWDASRGVMFFSTPHLGLNEEQWRRFAHRVLLRRAPSEGVVPTKKMLEELHVNSRMLDRVTEDFLPLQPDLSFVTFIEDRPMEGMDDVMVNHVYGFTRTPTETPRRLSGDHIGLCKFRNHKDDMDEFGLVQDGIRALIDDEPRAIHRLRYQEKRALHSLCPTSFHCHTLGQKPTKGTCAWIFDTPEMELWLANDSGKEKLWIHGPAGCGKSFLAQHIITKLHDGKTAAQHGVIHCALSQSHPSRGDLQALLRATLHQALHLVPELVTGFLLPTFEAAQGRDSHEQQIWTKKVLVTIWVDAMAEVMARQSLTLVIDGLDEMSKECQETFFDFLDELPQKAKEAFERLKQGIGETATPKMKLLAVSQGDEYIRGRLGRLGFKSYHIRSQDVKKDIKTTAWTRLHPLWKAKGRNADAQLEQTCNKIADNSKGSYLWATLVVEILRRSRTTREKDVLFLLRQFVEGDVDDLYSHILLGLANNPKSATFVQQVLQWAIFQQEGLKLSEFKIVDALAKATSEHTDQIITPEILGSFFNDNIKLRIEFHCGHLVKFQDDGRLSLVHRSFQHHLKNTKTKPTPRSPADLDNTNAFLDPQTAHAALANLCITYLTMPCFDSTTSNPHLPIPLPPTNATQQPAPPPKQQPPPTNPPNPQTFTTFESRLRHLTTTHPFLRYAALHWHEHLAAAGPAWPGKAGGPEAQAMLRERRSWLEDGENPYGRCWAEVWWFFVRGVGQAFPGEGTGGAGGLVGRVVGVGVALEGVEGKGEGGAAVSSVPASTPASAAVGVVGDGGRAGDRHRGSEDGGGSGGEVNMNAVGHAVKPKKQKRGGVERDPVVVEGRSEREGGEDSLNSFGREDERLDADEGDGSVAPPEDTSTRTTQNGGRQRTEREAVEQEVVYVEKIVYVDRPVVEVQTVEKSVVETITKEVEKIRKVEVERVEEVIVEVDKTPPKKQKIQLSRWGRVKKTGKKLVKEVFAK
ncbi:hypothetical protein F5144DRAFT_628115 [Chaetomium tenue]|uniref:Uncharacterized protein n=1 Tax=Chaetomium tenue TaxID=1854479 RepID=A0ACB7PAU2_9PEZI|nr:hypothetical protein F5144DRAFT_628115 [Chaetomium globosum]